MLLCDIHNSYFRLNGKKISPYSSLWVCGLVRRWIFLVLFGYATPSKLSEKSSLEVVSCVEHESGISFSKTFSPNPSPPKIFSHNKYVFRGIRGR